MRVTVLSWAGVYSIVMHPNAPNRYAIAIQTFEVSGTTSLCNDHQQSTRTIAISVWTEFEKSALLTWTAVCLYVVKHSDLFVYAPQGRTNTVYPKTLP